MPGHDEALSGAGAQDLQAEIARLNKIIQALMDRAERNSSSHDSDFNLFHTSVMLGSQVRQRTRELEAASLENEKITRALREQKEFLDTVFENALDAIVLMDSRGVITGWSRQAEKIFGWSKEEAVGRLMHETLVPERYREAHVRGMQQFLSTGKGSVLNSRMEIPALHRDGHEFTIELSIAPIKTADGYGISSFIRDISERQKLEHQLVEREALFRAVFDQADSGIELIDPDTLRFVEANPAACRMLGYTHEELLRLNLEDTQVDMDRKALLAAVRRIEEEGGAIFPNRHRCKNGGILDVEINAHILHLSGKRMIVALWRDVTEHKRAEEKLVAQEREFRTLAENSPDNIARYDRMAHTLYANPALERTLGTPLRDQLGKMPVELGPFEAYQQMLLQVAASGERATLEMSVPAEGRPRIHVIKMVPELGPDGVPVGVLAVGHDISEIKWAEESLRITASVFENSQEGIVITDADNHYLDVNPAFTRITGYTREEVLGKDPGLLNSGRQNQAFYQAMWQSLEQNRVWRGEVWNRRKSGEIYPELLSIAVIRDDQGRGQRYVGVFSDISHIKAHESELSHIAHYDALTGIPNRLLLTDRLGQSMTASKRSMRFGAVIFLDLDNFKALNDTHGHEMGDLLLIEAARRITDCVREMDTVARLGGDEFVVILSELDVDRALSVAQAGRVAEKIRSTLAEPYLLTRKRDDGSETRVEHHCTSSIGVEMFINHEASLEDVLKRADMAMYQAKENGRNRVHFVDTSLL
ncbi:MAG: hypothetical protein A2Z95_03455 [Gallionellales bacterium GWA2_60_18]|nr:MAG: hypothetical protein A2Z95_03455 [Gallionellales bacterium GWA2_60_18]